MKRSKERVAKADGDKDKVFRLTDIDPEFVSLVRAGANRQKQFMVVKEEKDGEVSKAIPPVIPGRVSPRTPGNVCQFCGAPVTHGAKTCPKCGRILTFASDDEKTGENANDTADDTNQDAPPADGQDGAAVSDTDRVDSGKTSDGTEATPKDASDLASWLNEAGEQIEELSLDIAIQNALDAQAVDQAKSGHQSDQAQEIGTTAAPAVTKEVDPGERERAAKLEAELVKTRRDNLALKAKNARLAAAAVGKSSVILTGEVTSRQQKTGTKTPTSPSRGAFSRGGDIAAAVTRGEN